MYSLLLKFLSSRVFRNTHFSMQDENLCGVQRQLIKHYFWSEVDDSDKATSCHHSHFFSA